MKIAVQVYSVRDHIKSGEDMLRVLGEIAAAGYEGVEFAGYAGLDAETLKKRCDEVGLTVVGGHIGLDDFRDDKVDDTLAFQKTLGTKFIGVGGAPHKTLAEITETSRILGAADKKAKESGMRVYYHNHTEEFTPVEDGKLPIDYLNENCALEIDTYWSFHAGQDNFALLNKYKDNIVHIHVKDGIDGKPMALGEGNCPIPEVLKAAESIGLEWIIVENDDPVPTGIEDITRSIKYLKSIM